MVKYCNIHQDKMPFILPSCGVTNIHHLITILIGWGCDFQVLLDYDTAGISEYKIITKNFGTEICDKLHFINLKTFTSTIHKDDQQTIEALISDNDNKKLKHPYDGTDATKILSAKNFYETVLNDVALEQITETNFQKLFTTWKLCS